MNYAEQERFLGRFRLRQRLFGAGVALVALVLLAEFRDRLGWYELGVALLLAAAAFELGRRAPLYLRLSVEGRKRYVWSVRTRLIATAVLGLATLPAAGVARGALLWGASVAIALAGALVCRWHLRRDRDAQDAPLVPLLLLAGDLAVLLLLGGARAVSPLFLSLGLTLAAVLFVLTSSGAALRAGLAAAAVALALLSWGQASAADVSYVAIAALLALPVLASVWALVATRAADRRHAANVEATVADLSAFALVPPEEAREMLAEATGMLARNWNESRPSGPGAVARWYEENSELYLYDLAQFHLAYKHIAFMLDVVALSRGRVLDYGAGIGDLALELSRRGHEAVYLDVEGRTKAFARWRADRDWLPVAFASDLAELDGAFDTIVSLDVFEHLAEPEPVVDALVDRLAPGGRMIVTAYFGPTRAHPMHFDHDLDLGRFLERRGLRSAKSFAMRHLRGELLRKRGVLVYEKR